MTTDDDALAGFRAPEPNAEFTEDELRLQEALVNRNRIMELISAGQDFARFLETPAGKRLWESSADQLASGIQTLLATHDLSGESARLAHFNARVALSVLQQFQSAIDQGREMADQLRRSEDDRDHYE